MSTAADILPGNKEEDWRWTDLSYARAFMDVPAPANDSAVATEDMWLPVESERHLFVAGRGEGAVSPIMRAPAHPLADLAARKATSGSVLHVAAGADGGTVQLLHVGTGGSAHGVTRVTLEEKARLIVVENFADIGGDHWLNHRFDAELAPGAELIRIVRVHGAHGLVTGRSWVEVGAGARYHEVMLSVGEAASRLEAQVELAGEGAKGYVNGALLGDGRARTDVVIHVNHSMPKTESDQLFRLVGREKAQLSVAGTVHVAVNAQHVRSNQLLGGLVLDRTAQCNLKPELEIYADDVKCDHGATVGELDKNALFYLESRGVPRVEAEALLTEAFVADVFHCVPAPLAEVLEDEGRAWLEGQAR